MKLTDPLAGDAPVVLSLCDRTGNMVRPWLDAGHECWIVDIQHEPGAERDGNLVHIGADVTTWLPPLRRYTAAVAVPPCTHLAISGARWFQDKGLGALIEGLTVVERCRQICEWSGAPYLIENPVGTLSSYWRKPDHMFDPFEYGGWVDGDDYTKRTCLWTGGGFVMPPKHAVEPTQGSKMHLMAPGPDRADRRSETPMGFALAVFHANQQERAA